MVRGGLASSSFRRFSGGFSVEKKADLFSGVFMGFKKDGFRVVYTGLNRPFLRVLGVGFFALFLGCASPRPAEPFQTKLFVGTYDEVWLATLKALNDYPLKMSNKDSGKIQTEVVNGPYNELVFSYPDPIELPERFRYSLTFKFAKLIDEGRKPMVRVRVTKDLEQYQDFYTGWTAYSADGLEERIVLYRIQHILGMEQTLAKQEDVKK